MFFRYILVAQVVVVLLSSMAQARDVSLNAVMSDIGGEMTALYPLIYAERELSEKEIDEITARLEKMSTLFEEAGPHFDERSTTYSVSYEYIKPYLRETIHTFRKHEIDYARSRMYGISAICTSCHTQDMHLRTMFEGTSRQSFSSDYVYAEFNYLTRNYSGAEGYFNKYLKGKKDKTEFQIIRPMQRLITIYTQIYNRPGDGAELLAKYQKLPDHTPETKAALQGWIRGLLTLEKRGVRTIKNPDFRTLKTYVQQYLGKTDQPLSELYLPEDQQIYRVWLRGQLYHYLGRNPKPDEIPQILFWLSICDRSVGYNFYFSLADMYLKDCVYSYSRHPFAKKCYSEYKTFITSAYTGSGGTFLPAGIKEELQRMEKVLRSHE